MISKKLTKNIVCEGLLLLKETQMPIQIESQEWTRWLTTHNQFLYTGEAIQFSARKERRRNTQYWYAYKRIKGVLVKRYLGKNNQLTHRILDDTEEYFLNDFWGKNKDNYPLSRNEYLNRHLGLF